MKYYNLDINYNNNEIYLHDLVEITIHNLLSQRFQILPTYCAIVR